MSKRIEHTYKFKLQKVREQNKRYGRIKKRSYSSRKKYLISSGSKRPLSIIDAPRVLSIKNNTEATVTFMNRILSQCRDRDFVIKTDNVHEMGSEIPILLLSTLRKASFVGQANFRGTFPKDNLVEALLVGSGILDFIKHDKKETIKKGLIVKEEHKQVVGKTAQKLIREGMTFLHGHPRGHKSSYSALVDLMSNTHKHANPINGLEGTETWWATAVKDQSRKRLCFTFIDTGVGILESLPKKSGLMKIWSRIFRHCSRTDILRDLLEGGQSRTGLPYRGKGLPKLRQFSVDRKIRSLRILTSNVFADIEMDEYIELTAKFRGTLVYWEVES